MNSHHVQGPRFMQSGTALFILLLCLPWGSTVFAQAQVSGVFTHRKNATTATSYVGNVATGSSAAGVTAGSYNYKFGTNVGTPNIEVLDSFTVAAVNYYFVHPPTIVKFQRQDNAYVTGLRKSLWIEYNSALGAGSNIYLNPDYDDSLERVFNGQTFNIGIDNNFQNTNATNNNNIERVDVIFPAGVKASDVTKAGFVVFDRGAAGGHDGFQIAAIKTLGAGNDPSTYYAAVTAATGNYGSLPLAVGNVNYHILRKNPSDTRLLIMNNDNTQSRDGVFFSFSNLNVTNNTVIYGYSIFGPDVTTSPVIKMVDYTNNSYFPQNSNWGGGGLDMVAVTGLAVTNASFVIVLPSTLTHFNASQQDNAIALDWQLGTTENIKDIVIERSGNGAGFNSIAVVNGIAAGMQYADRQPLPEKNYYRLKIESNDGTFTYSAIITVDMHGAVSSRAVKIYPVPVKNRQLILDAQQLSEGIYYLAILDMDGKPVWKQQIKGGPTEKKQISLPDGLAAGVYHARLSKASGELVAVKALVIE